MLKLKAMFQSEKLKGLSKKVFTKKKVTAAIMVFVFLAGLGIGYSTKHEGSGTITRVENKSYNGQPGKDGQFVQGQNNQRQPGQGMTNGQSRNNGSMNGGPGQNQNTPPQNGVSNQGSVDGVSSATVGE